MYRGLKLTFSHFLHANKRRKPIGIENDNYFEQQNGLVTLTYPHEVIPVPDHGRYRLDNAIDDCIVCDLCAKICPVNCIDIEAIKSPEEIGKTSDGTTKRLYAGVFDIDMAKCCFCGLCTTVCPTESLTMTKTYDFSEFDVLNMNYHYSDLSPEDAKEKQAIYDESQRIKAELKKQKEAETQAAKAEKENHTDTAPIAPKPKIAGMPVIKPAIPKTEDTKSEVSKPKPIIRPVAPKPTEDKTKNTEEDPKPAAAKPAFKPIIKPVIKKAETDSKLENVEPKETDSEKKSAPKLVIKPNIKPVIKPIVKKEESNPESENKIESEKQDEPKPKIKPVIKPIIRPVAKKPEDETPKETESESEKPKQPIKPVIRPIIKPVIKPKKDDNEQAE
jgi:formate hydrogenlyase subunit 6/NADH:ubiquinone oxidoreductase subunit I